MSDADRARPVLVPLDLSDSSGTVLEWGVRAALCFGAPLLLLHVVHDPGSAPGTYSRGVSPDLVQSLEETGRTMFQDFVEAAADRYPRLADVSDVRSRTVVGLPASRILEVADEESAQLIVMGSAGRTGWSKLLLGSKALRVAQLAPVPVTIVKAPNGPGAEEAS